MARTLYRIYLYGVWLFLMVLATIAVGVVLGTLLSASPLNGAAQVPLTDTAVTQQVVFALLAVVIVAVLGGLHYWLIRRDIRDDPAAATGPVRALFLNGVEAVAVLAAAPTLAFALASQANPYAGGVASAIAAGLVALGLFALLETERCRSSAAPGAALVLQRLHFYGVQLILLFIATPFWLNAIDSTVTTIFAQAGLLTFGCGPNNSTVGTCNGPIYPGVGEPLPNLVWLWTAAAFITLVIVGYGVLVRHDGRSALRLVLHFASYGYGLIFVLVAVYRVASLLLSVLQGQTVTANDFVFSYEFLAPAVFGVLVVAVYASWLARDALRGAASAHSVGLTALAVTIAIFAVPFWIGCALVAFNLLTAISPATASPTPDQWTNAVATLVAGGGYVPFSLRMRVLARRYAPATPRRGLVFALLGAGTLTAAIGLLVTLYAIVTAAAGAALDNWQVVARAGGVAFFIGAIIVGIYVSRARVEGWFRRAAPVASATPPVAVAAPSVHAASYAAPVTAAAELTGASTIAIPPVSGSEPTVEDVLDALLAGKLTRDEAAGRLREMRAPGV